MKRSISIRTQVLGVIAISFGFVLMTSLLCLKVYSERRAVKRLESIASKMANSGQSQMSSILPALLIVEQNGALDLQLQRMRENEHLDEARFVVAEENNQASPDVDGTCTVATFNEPRMCVDLKRATSTAVVPAVFDGKVLGHLIKVKSVDAEVGGVDLSQNEPLLFVAVSISLGFLVLAIWVSLFLDRYIRRPLLSLDSSLEPILSGAKNELPMDARVTEINAVLSQIQRLVEKFQDRKSQAAVGLFAAQVAHDIKSPLAALAMAEKNINSLPEDSRILVRSAVGRIQDIANQLLERNRGARGGIVVESKPIAAHLLSSVIDGILSEKRMQYRSKIGVEIETSWRDGGHGVFANVRLGEFKRVISNLINNAVESLAGAGKITVTVGSDGDRVVISVQDSGKGIEPEVLGNLTRRGQTHGKVGGSGLGLHHAKTSCEAWGGYLSIESRVGHGTTVSLVLPKAQTPAWFVGRLRLHARSQVVVLDDDSSIHAIWKGRMEAEGALARGVELIHFSTPTELLSWQKSALRGEEVRYLIDYELIGFDDTGLDIIERLGIARQSILVTSRFEEASIRERCQALGVPMIPKGMAGFVPIAINDQSRCDVVLLDDDQLVRMTWASAAKKANQGLRVFSQASELLEVSESLDENTPIYIDESLAGGVSGLIVAKGLHQRGFTRLYLATGHAVELFGSQPWLSGIVGKEPPFL